MKIALIIVQIILLSLALAADAFSVSIVKGACYKKKSIKLILYCGLFFGISQGLMSLIGYLLGTFIMKYIDAYDHIIAFVILVALGVKMIVEGAKKKKDEEEKCDIPSIPTMLLLALATSLDALAAGLSLTVMQSMYAYIAIGSITIVTLGLSMVGVIIGVLFNKKFKNKAEIIGGIILVLIGIKILVEGIINLN
ncbi:MAG: manganese efflux pump MntP family protein [Acholeplasmatales bacterium]|jgi:putative Mn2+ efflux pump MntP|nr:manganese efflux pump MntP family protein [Acholeplasmatales bacterium]